MFVRICVVTVLSMGALAGPALGAEGASANSRAAYERPTQLVQLKRFFTPKVPRSLPRCGFGQC
jgi:hypothetical protein